MFVAKTQLRASMVFDKIRFESLNGKSKLDAIHIIPHKATNTVMLIDSGIRITKSDLVKNLGTIVHWKVWDEGVHGSTDCLC